MPNIPLLPQGHHPVGSAAYNQNTHKFIANQKANGNIDSTEGAALAGQQHQIHAERQQDLQNGVDPKSDPTLRREQMQHRATANRFANGNFDDQLNGCQCGGGSSSNPSPSGPGLQKSDSSTGPDGTTQVDVGGYGVSFNPQTGVSDITNLATGQGIENWGDPHTKAIGPDQTTGNWSSGTSTFVLPNGERVTENASAANGEIGSVTITGPYGKRQEVIDANGTHFQSAQAIDQGVVYTPNNDQLSNWTGSDGNVL